MTANDHAEMATGSAEPTVPSAAATSNGTTVQNAYSSHWWPKYASAEARKAGTRKADSTAPQRARFGPADVARCGPVPRASTIDPPTTANADDASTALCQGKSAPPARIAWGSAVPSTSMPTSHASVSPARPGPHVTTSFIPTG